MMRLIFSLAAGSIALIVFCLYAGSAIFANADAIFPFSFCMDIIQHLPIRTWMFPVPTFIFPDMILSFPFVYFFRDPLIWLNVASVLQPLCLILLSCLYLQSEKSKLVLFAPVTYIMILLYAMGCFLSPPDWHFFSSLFLLVHHMFTAIFALFFYLWNTPQKLKQINLGFFIPACILFFLGSYSDLFFFLYFFAFVFSTILVYQRKIFGWVVWIKSVSIYFISGFLGVLTNNYTNHKILKQIQHTSQTFSPYERLLHFSAMVYAKGVLLFLGLPFLFFILYILFAKNLEQRKIVLSLMLGYFFIMAGLIFSGLISADINTLRYAAIYFPILLFVGAYLLPHKFLTYFATIPVSISVIFIALGVVYTHWSSGMGISYPTGSQELFSCNDFQRYSKNATVVAEYWQAKILFEGSHRSFHLIQTNNNLVLYRWIDNTSWRKRPLPSVPLPNNHFLFVMDGLTDTTQAKIRAVTSSMPLCEGKVILVPKNVEL